MTQPTTPHEPAVGASERRRRFRSGDATHGFDRRAAPLLLESPAPPRIRRRDRRLRAALLTSDVAASAISAAAIWFAFGASGPRRASLLLVVLVPIVFAAHRLYRLDEQRINSSTLDEAPAIFSAATLVTVLAYLAQSAILAAPLGAKVVGAAWMTLIVCSLSLRALARALSRRLLPPERCLVIGDHAQGHRLAAKLADGTAADAELVGVMPLTGDADRGARLSQLASVIDRASVHRVVIVGDAHAPQLELELIQAAKALGVKVSVVPRVLEVVGSSASYDYVDGLTMLGVPQFGLSRASRLTKRALDVVGSMTILVLAGPLMAVIALAVKLTSSGPVLFRQTRIGRDGAEFSILKFRTMEPDAESRKDSLRYLNEADGLFKITDDPRITSLGRTLRRASLDELPQLLNVVRGEMSLVGPRPLVPDEDRMVQGWHRRRLHLTPGMTGPWQVLGSARIPLEEMATIDYLYVANWTLWADVKLLLRTVGAVVARTGR